MYGLSPAIAILDITMGKLSKFSPQLPFPGKKAKIFPDGERSHAEEKEKYVGPYDNSPVPRLTIHSFIMGVFVRVLIFADTCEQSFLTSSSFRYLWEASSLVTIRDKSLDSW